MHDLAVVSIIQKIEPIEGKDRIVLATVNNYKSVVAKDEFKEGDTVVYCFYDSILPQREEFEFLRKRCWSPKYNGFRIRPMKLGQVISEGLVLSMSVLPSNKRYKVGQVVTEELGITLYDPEYDPRKKKPEPKGLFKTLMRIKGFRKIYNSWLAYKKAHSNMAYPNWITKSDEDNIEKVWDSVCSLDDEFIVTEKMEGMSTTYSVEKGKFKVYSHNWRVKSGAWVEYAKKTHLDEKLIAYCKKYKLKSFSIQGELCGPGIQRNIYNLKDYTFFMFGGYYSDHKKLYWSEIEQISGELGIQTVPFIKNDKPTNYQSVDDILKDSDGKSVVYNTKREGFVWRNESGSTHFKVKSRDYKVSWEKLCEKDGE